MLRINTSVTTTAIPIALALILTVFSNYQVLGQEDAPQLSDPNLSIQLVSDLLNDPTSMAFLNSDDILVAEKSTGKVQRIVNGQMLDEPVIDVNVNSEDERGLLGIAVSKNVSSEKTYVFLFYTESVAVEGTEEEDVGGEEDEDNTRGENGNIEDGDGGEPMGNRLYRYEFVDGKLVNPKLLLDLPYLPGPAHNGGVIAIGPDNNVYVTLGELTPTSYGQGDYRFLSQNYEDGEEPDGRGGILRVTQDGKVVVDDNNNNNNNTSNETSGILGNEHPLNMYYAYGIRNSFGLDFDPVTGNLWDTENGPSYGDELNLVEPGFNSGWAKVLGIWQVNEVINEEDEREINKGEISATEPADLIDFEGRGKYSQPELTWDETIAPTALIFLNTDKLGKQYENDLLVASVKSGILHFDLDQKDRKSLVLNGSLADKVADTVDELVDVTFATNLGIITDLEVGPDGALYILTGVRSTEGKIYRVVASSPS